MATSAGTPLVISISHLRKRCGNTGPLKLKGFVRGTPHLSIGIGEWEMEPWKSRDTWFIRMVGGISTPSEFTISAVFRCKSDFDDFIEALHILQGLADDEPEPGAEVLLGGVDALAALCPA